MVEAVENPAAIARWELLPSTIPDDIAITIASSLEGWKHLYVCEHQKKASAASDVIKFVDQCCKDESVEVVYFLKAVTELNSFGFGFKDVQMFLLTTKNNVLLNLAGLLYAILRLKVHPTDVMKALHSNQVSERRVCVTWFTIGRWFYGFRLNCGFISRMVSLEELTLAKNDDILQLLNRGVVHDVLRVKITPVSEYKP